MSYNEEPIINYDPEGGDYTVKWVHGVPVKEYL